MRILTSQVPSTSLSTAGLESLALRESPRPKSEVVLDRIELSGKSDPGKVLGTQGAAAGALVGRFTVLPALGAVGLATLGSRLLPGVGGWVGGAVGALVGLGLEFGSDLTKTPQVGHIVGGMVGGVAGLATGKALSSVGWDPKVSKDLACDSESFSLKSLPGRLLRPDYTSHEKLGEQVYQEIMEFIQPGDVVVTTQNADQRTEALQWVLEGKGNWVHGTLYAGEGLVYDSNSYLDGVTQRPLRQALAVSERVRIIRPQYAEGEAEATIHAAESALGNEYAVPKDLSDGPTYCTGAVYNALRKGAPSVKVEHAERFGLKLVTGDSLGEGEDMVEIYSNGSSLKQNYRSKFL